MRIGVCILLVLAAAIGAILIQNGPTAIAKGTEIVTLQPSSNVTSGQLDAMDKTGKAIGQCPLKHTSVKADVSGFVARVDVVQEFVNPLNEKIEAVYVFPLPQDAAVDRMEMTVGDRTIRGEVKTREEARQIYDDARQSGHVASLLDQERPNIFTQSVANIMPGETIKIKISYVDVLKYENGQFEFVFPMVVGPRYIPGNATGKQGEGWSPDTDQVPDASNITPPVTPKGTRAGHDISVEVNLHAGMPVYDIESVLHEVDNASDNGSDVCVKLKDEETIPNKDFILRYRVAGDNVQTGLLPNTRSAGDGYFSLMLVPPKAPRQSQVAPKEMIFVIDSSGSQQGWPIEKSKETMRRCIEEMNPNDTFQMLAFSNDVVTLFDKPMPNTKANRALAEEFLTSRLGSGGTEMMKAVIAALKPDPDPERLRMVCFMTDGYVGNDFEILDAIKRNIGDARLFSFGIGNSVNRFLLDGMADMGRGAVEYVTLEEQGSKAAAHFFERTSKPVLTDISIDWGGLPVQDVYPQKIPDLFSSKPLILKGRYTGAMEGTITIRGKLGGKPWQERVRVDLPAQEDENQALPSLWARAKIADLMTGDYSGLQNGNTDPKIKDQITQVALEYQLMSQFTSFVAVEETTVTEGGVPKKIAVPVEMPEGVSYEGIFGDKEDASYALKSCAPSGPAGRVGSPSVCASMPASPVDCIELPGADMPKLDASLIGLAQKLDKNGNYTVKGKIEVKNGKVMVSIRLSDDSAANLAKLKKLGFELLTSTKSVSMVIGYMPVAKLDKLEELDFVLKIAPVN